MIATAQKKGPQRLTLRASVGCGEGGIRTPGTLSCTQHFQCCTIGHSVTSPGDPVGDDGLLRDGVRAWGTRLDGGLGRGRVGLAK
jgi:hypothetical protein